MGFSPRVNRWLWRLFLPAFSLAAGHQVNRERRLRGLGSLGNVFDHFVTANPVLATDAALAGIPGDVGAERRVLGIPALYPLGGEPLPEKLETFLQSGPPPVYVGFGSMTDPDPRATTRLVLEAIERVGCRAVLSSGWAGLGDAALPSTVMVVNEVSHASLFPHCAAVVHHGGAGTTTSAARAGVRQLVVPHVVDQFYWGSRVQRHGVAPQPLPRKRLAAEPLAATLRALLDNELAAERAEELGARLHDEYPRRFRPDAILDADGHS
jgi:UDP:flavonoid glycosyltransferase YjiC (YdhE family)